MPLRVSAAAALPLRVPLRVPLRYALRVRLPLCRMNAPSQHLRLTRPPNPLPARAQSLRFLHTGQSIRERWNNS